MMVIASVFGVALVTAAFVFAYQFVEPAPPETIVMATGEEGGAYQAFAEQLAAEMAAEGIAVELRATAGSAENIALLEQPGGVDIAFVQGGLASIHPTENVVALGSMYFEPLWIFADASAGISGVRDLANMRIAVGAEGSGTRAIVVELLAANGVDEGNAEFMAIAMSDLADALASSRVDAAFVIAGPTSELVQTIVKLPNMKLLGMRRAAAYVRQFPFLSAMSLPEGVLDLRNNFPSEDVETVALTAMLAAKEDLHPALVDLLLVAAERVHGKHSLLADAGEFPTPRYIDLPLDEEAERHYKYGPPFLIRYLPFWAATMVDRPLDHVVAFDRPRDSAGQTGAAGLSLEDQAAPAAHLLGAGIN